MTQLDLRHGWGALVMTVAAVLGLILAVWNYAAPMTGVTGTAGALLVVFSSLALAVDGVLLYLLRPGAIHRVLAGLGALGVLGTFVAAWFLHAWWLMAAMAVVAIGVLVESLLKTHTSAKGTA